MPTQEERLLTVENDLKQFKSETIKTYQEMAMEVPMAKGLTEDAILRLATLKVQIDQRFGQVDARLDRVDGRLDRIETRFDRVETRLDRMETALNDIDRIKKRLEHVETGLESLGQQAETQFALLNQRLDAIVNLLTSGKPTLPEQ